MKKSMLLLGCTVALGLLIQCGKKEEDEAETTVLEGTWETGCIKEETGSYKVSAAFAGYDLAQTITYFSDDACATLELTRVQNIGFTIGDAGDVGIATDQEVMSCTQSYDTDAGAAIAKAGSYYEYTDWEKGVAKVITDKKMTTASEVDCVSGVEYFTVFAIDDKTLMFGSGSTEEKDASTADKRHDTLDTTIVFTKI